MSSILFRSLFMFVLYLSIFSWAHRFLADHLLLERVSLCEVLVSAHRFSSNYLSTPQQYPSQYGSFCTPLPCCCPSFLSWRPVWLVHAVLCSFLLEILTRHSNVVPRPDSAINEPAVIAPNGTPITLAPPGPSPTPPPALMEEPLTPVPTKPPPVSVKYGSGNNGYNNGYNDCVQSISPFASFSMFGVYAHTCYMKNARRHMVIL